MPVYPINKARRKNLIDCSLFIGWMGQGRLSEGARHQVFFCISFLSLNFFTKQTWWNLTNPAISLLKNKKWLLLYKEFLLQGQGSHFIICLLLIAFYGVKDLHLYPCYLYSIYQYHLIIHPSFSGFRVWGSKHGKNNSLSILYSNFIGHLCCKA